MRWPLCSCKCWRCAAARGLPGSIHVAVDGTKIKANASKHKAMSYARMVEAEAELAREVAEWLARAQAEDAAEDAEHGTTRRGDEPPDWMRDKQARLARIRAAKAELEAEARGRRSHQACAAVQPGRQRPSAAGQTAAASAGSAKAQVAAQLHRSAKPDHERPRRLHPGLQCSGRVRCRCKQIIVAHRLTNNGSDQDALLPLLDAIEVNTGETADEVSADNGFCSEANLEGLNATHSSRLRGAWARKQARWRQERRSNWFRPCVPAFAKADIEADTACENTPSNPSSDTSSRPEASDNSSSAASTR